MRRIQSKLATCWIAAAALALIAAPALAGQTRDAYISSKVKIELLKADLSSPMDINVDTHGGIVTLGGRVDSDAAKREAEEVARRVSDVRDVRNMLAVVPEAQKKEIFASDDQLERRIATVLDRDMALEKSDIHVKSVHGGNAILTGRADTLTSHQRALEDARSVEGVRRVASEIETENADPLADEQVRIESPQRGLAGAALDAWITSKVRFRLIRHPGIAPFAINVDTQDGIVTLFGNVGAEVDKRDAGRQAMMVSGVKDVQNELQVVSQVAEKQIEKRDGEIRNSLVKRLDERDGLGNDDIDVEVANGVVRLTGSVDSPGDRMTALSLARTTDGVRSVVDGLRVEYKG